MPRSRPRSRLTITLFPFLSVLAATIGALILIISGLTAINLHDTEQLIDMSSVQNRRRPRYVECDATGFILHPEGTVVPLEELDGHKNPFRELLEALDMPASSETLTLLIRPDGEHLSLGTARRPSPGRDPCTVFDPRQ